MDLTQGGGGWILSRNYLLDTAPKLIFLYNQANLIHHLCPSYKCSEEVKNGRENKKYENNKFQYPFLGISQQWWLCPEGSFVKVFNPTALCPRVDFVYLHYNFKLLWIFAARKLFGVDNMAFWGWNDTMFYFYVAYVCLTCIGRPFAVKNSPWKKRDILLGPCSDNMTAG